MSKTQAITSFINGGANEIEGWFYPHDMVIFYLLDAMQKQLDVRGNIAEVGVYKGKSLALLGMLARDEEQLYAFDAYPEDYLQKTRDVVQQFCPWPLNLHYITGDTAAYTTAQLQDTLSGRLRLLHIDAGHEYHEVLHSLYLIAPFVSDDGIIIMDDYHDREFPGVAAAALDFCLHATPRQFAPFLIGGNKIYLCTPGNSTRYHKSILSQNTFVDAMRLSRIRDHLVLVTASKLPMKSAMINQLIDNDVRDFSLQVDIERLARIATRNAQNTTHAAAAVDKA